MNSAALARQLEGLMRCVRGGSIPALGSFPLRNEDMFAKSFILLLALTSFVDANAQSASAPQIPTVAYCELLSKPDDYDGKRIRIRAEYNSGFEHSYNRKLRALNAAA